MARCNNKSHRGECTPWPRHMADEVLSLERDRGLGTCRGQSPPSCSHRLYLLKINNIWRNQTDNEKSTETSSTKDHLWHRQLHHLGDQPPSNSLHSYLFVWARSPSALWEQATASHLGWQSITSEDQAILGTRTNRCNVHFIYNNLCNTDSSCVHKWLHTISVLTISRYKVLSDNQQIMPASLHKSKTHVQQYLMQRGWRGSVFWHTFCIQSIPAARELFPCTHQRGSEGWTGCKCSFSSLRYDPTGNRT